MLYRKSYTVDSRLAPSQWETSLQSNAVPHWLGGNHALWMYGARLDKHAVPVMFISGVQLYWCFGNPNILSSISTHCTLHKMAKFSQTFSNAFRVNESCVCCFKFSFGFKCPTWLLGCRQVTSSYPHHVSHERWCQMTLPGHNELTLGVTGPVCNWALAWMNHVRRELKRDRINEIVTPLISRCENKYEIIDTIDPTSKSNAARLSSVYTGLCYKISTCLKRKKYVNFGI